MAREYWNRELETKPWREVEAWQASKLAEFLPSLPRRSRLYGDRSLGAAPLRSFEALDSLPFTPQDALRPAPGSGGRGPRSAGRTRRGRRARR